jgi:hypothetical protein
VKLEDQNDFPDSGDLSTSDVLGATILNFPDPSAEVFGNLELHLDPGWYALVFGSGLFGAAGLGGALLNNPDIGAPSYIAFLPNGGWTDLSTLPGPFENFRLVVQGKVVPEPASEILTLLAITVLLVTRFQSRRSDRPDDLDIMNDFLALAESLLIFLVTPT